MNYRNQASLFAQIANACNSNKH